MNEFERRTYAELARAKDVIDEQERLQKLIEPFQGPLRHLINATPTASQIIEQHAAHDLANFHRTTAEIGSARALVTAQEQLRLGEHERMQKLIQQIQDPLARQLANVAPTVTQIIEQNAARDLANLHRNTAEIEVARALGTVQQQFHLPTWDSGLELELKRMVTENRWLSDAAPNSWLDAMKHSVLQRHQPWLNELELTSSIRAMAEIQILGAAINAANPYSDSVTEATRKVLGDWSLVTDLPQEIFTDAATRHSFYLAHGYDSALSTLPTAARVEGMYRSGLIDAPQVPIQVERGVAVSDEPDGFELAAEAREILVGLERKLRHFVGTKMHEICGPQWTKQRVPAGVAQNIKERRAEDQRVNGKQHPPVEYLDFPDYAPIIIRTDNWEAAFKDHFLRQESVKESFLRLSPIRNAAMHSRPLTQEDMDFLYVEVRRLDIAMQRALPTADETLSDDA